MAQRKQPPLALTAIEWLLRFPFLGPAELALLLGIAENTASRILAELERLGWTEWVVPASPELEPRRLYVLTEAGLAAVAEALSADNESLSGSYQVGRREILIRLTRLETTAGLNRLFAALATAATADVEVDLADARSLPWAARARSQHWPPEIEAYGCLKWGPWYAPFFVAWDRAGAPPIHRRNRVSSWYSYDNAENPWSRDGIPPILIVCPGEREAEEWARAVINSADRRGGSPPTVFITNVSAVLRDPLGEIWRRVDGFREALLCERLRWIPEDVVQRAMPARPQLNLKMENVSAAGTPLREWACTRIWRNWAERLAASSLGTSAMQKTMMEWIGHHPLLSADDLAVPMRLRPPLAERLVARLVEWTLVGAVAQPMSAASPPPTRYFMTNSGLRLLAARDGVPPQRYARYGVIAAPTEGKRKRGGRLESLIWQFDHTVGVNSFFVRLATDARADGGRVVRWLNASESAERFTYCDLERWLRPDGYAEIELDDRARCVFLEWDRGTMFWPKLIEKLQSYAAYFASRKRGESSFDTSPDVLVVTNSHQRENSIWHLLASAFDGTGASPDHMFTSIDTLVERLGPFAPIWRLFETSGRISWQDGGTRADQRGAAQACHGR